MTKPDVGSSFSGPQNRSTRTYTVAPSSTVAPSNAKTGNRTIGEGNIRRKDAINRWLASNFLEVKLDDGSTASIRMDNFLEITDPEYWLHGEVLSAALAFEKEKASRNDVLVIGEVYAQMLYSVSMETMTVEDLLAQYSDKVKQRFRKSRWIAVPCSDGIIAAQTIGPSFKNAAQGKENTVADERAAPAAGKGNDATSKSKRSTSKSESQRKAASTAKAHLPTPPAYHAHGNHWGLLIVDKHTRVARWVDSNITLDTRDGKDRIAHMSTAGEAAGRVLHALELVFASQDATFAPGSFETSTLKYTPQQGQHNDAPFDGGACGLFAVEFLRHILGRPDEMHDLKAMFPSVRRSATRFNSSHMRLRIQTEILRRKEASSNNTYNFSTEFLQALQLTPAQVNNLVRGIGTEGRTTLGRRGSDIQKPINLSNEQKLWMKQYKEHRKQEPEAYEGANRRERRDIFNSTTASLETHRQGDIEKGSGMDIPSDVDTDDVSSIYDDVTANSANIVDLTQGRTQIQGDNQVSSNSNAQRNTTDMQESGPGDKIKLVNDPKAVGHKRTYDGDIPGVGVEDASTKHQEMPDKRPQSTTSVEISNNPENMSSKAQDSLHMTEPRAKKRNFGETEPIGGQDGNAVKKQRTLPPGKQPAPQPVQKEPDQAAKQPTRRSGRILRAPKRYG